ncbi:MAG: bifunctional adenosylcobinamide kinase/adenosylcobinamide-phosphate guanylyltransferase [Firmicutes bacterium]|nr:bifunctional adenosylcobinamide kinase/adenosylcobinamide-phosphate guanylyltransferase [Bacillota bacterium]
MGKLVFVTGGARSGKSRFAEKLAAEQGKKVLYIATSIPFDDEMKIRIEIHRARRPEEWETVEAYRDLDKVIENNLAGKSAVLLDCITVMITNLMVESNSNWDKMKTDELYNIEAVINCEIDKFIYTAKKKEPLFVAVSNEVGMGLVPEYVMSRVFRDIAGRINQKLADAADEVFFCVSGIPLKIK